MNQYTILLMRPDYVAEQYGEDTYLAHISAENVQDAQVFAQEEAFRVDDLDTDDGESPDAYLVLLVVEGIHHDIKETS